MDASGGAELNPHNKEWESFFDSFVKDMQRGRAAIFVGAGLSMDAFPDWRGLVDSLAKKELGIVPEPAMALPDVAQYVANKLDPKWLHERVRMALGEAKGAKPGPAHLELPGLGLDVIWTTNYDDLIECAYSSYPGRLGVVSDDNLFHETGTTTLFKLHGTRDDAGTIVIAREDYERYRATHEGLYAALLSDLLRRSFLFVGFSFVDPNVYGALYQAHRVAESGRPPHFAVFCEKDRDKVSESLRIEDLERLGVHALYVTDWHELPKRLRQLRRRVSRRRVLVSGSKRGQGTVPEEDLRVFSKQLGRMLIRRGYTIVCGLNPAVGAAVVDGGLEQLYEEDKRAEVNSRIVIRPLPKGEKDDSERKRMRNEFRREMAGVSGIGIFLGGGGGTGREYEMLLEAGGMALPVGASGGTASKLWNAQSAKFPADLREDFAALGAPGFDDERLLRALDNLLEALTSRPV